MTKVSFLGHIIGENGLEIESSKLDAVKKWPIPISVKQIQSFLGLCNYLRRFIHQYAHVTAPLT
jgi:hypothetical protein